MKARLLGIMALLLIVVLFTLQNTEMVTIRFFLWSYAISGALLIFLLLTVGIILGLGAATFQRRQQNRPESSSLLPKDSSHDQRDNP